MRISRVYGALATFSLNAGIFHERRDGAVSPRLQGTAAIPAGVVIAGAMPVTPVRRAKITLQTRE
jgi:hypothetical protein